MSHRWIGVPREQNDVNRRGVGERTGCFACRQRALAAQGPGCRAMSTTRTLAGFSSALSFEAIGRDVLANAQLAIMDSIATLYAGLREPAVLLVRDAALREGAAGPATVIGTGKTASATAAALANGAAAHALDYDSISLTVSGFVASPLLFALLALVEGESAPVSGRQLLQAFVAGWETEAAIARGLGVYHYAKGWHSTATLGHFGAAAAACRLLNLDLDATRSALGIVASEASGLRTMIGNMTNPFHVGKAARNAVFAAQLARAGFRAEPCVLEHPSGFAMAFNGKDGFDLDRMTAELGRRWDLVDPGLVIKVYPCCGLIHSAIDATLDLKSEFAIEADAVLRVEVAVHALVPPTMKFHAPASGYEAKFSTGFCIANALLEGSVRLEHFSDARTADPRMARLMHCVHMVVHPDLLDAATFLEREFSEVTITLRDGRSLTRRVNRIANRGSRGRPADVELIRVKAADCLAASDRADGAARALGLLENLPDIADVRDIMVQLA